MRVGKRPVETVKDRNEDCDRAGRNEIGKICGNGHGTLLSMGCVSIRPLRALKTLAPSEAFEPWLDMARWEAVALVPIDTRMGARTRGKTPSRSLQPRLKNHWCRA